MFPFNSNYICRLPSMGLMPSNFSETAGRILFFLILVGVLAMFLPACSGAGIFINPNDEITYFNAGRLFAECGSLRANISVLGRVSALGGFGWYGPFYGFLYGIPEYFSGGNPLVFPIMNFLWFAFTAWVLLKGLKNHPSKWVAAAGILALPAASQHIFTFFPESFHYFSGSLLSILLLKIYSTQGNKTKQLACFGLIIFFFSLFRPTTIFWLSALLPLAKSLQKKTLFVFGFFISGLLAAAYIKLFFAPFSYQNAQTLDLLFRLNIPSFFLSWISVIKTNLLLFTVDAKAWLFGFLAVITFLRACIEKKALFVAACIPPCLLAIALLSFYEADSFYFFKQMGFFMPLLALPHLLNPPAGLKTSLFIILVAGLIPFSLKASYHELKIRQLNFDWMKKMEKQLLAFRKIQPAFPPSKKTIITLLNLRQLRMKTWPLAFLPVCGNNGQVLHYAYDPNVPATGTDEFFLNADLPLADYILSAIQINEKTVLEKNLQLIYQDENIFLYQPMGRDSSADQLPK